MTICDFGFETTTAFGLAMTRLRDGSGGQDNLKVKVYRGKLIVEHRGVLAVLFIAKELDNLKNLKGSNLSLPEAIY